MDWEYTVLGLCTGILVGMTGMGGGSLMTPLLVFLFGVPPSTAIGTDIAHGAAFKTASAVQHRRMGNVRARLAGWMLIGSAPASLIGVFGGFIVGLTSVGSGVFFGLTLLVIFPLRAHKVVGTDIFHAAALLYVAGAAHWFAGNVDFALLSWLLLGSIPGVLLGGRLTLSIPERPL